MAKNKFQCPQCGVPIRANGKTGSMVCPACGFAIASAAAELGKADASNDLGINVIKYEGDNSTFVWKHPVTDFNMGTMLIVHESQEAVFFSGGQILDTFGPGRHVLKTENIPLLKKFYRIPTGGANMFHAEIYFINRTVQMGIRWGTPDRVRFIDPATGIPLDIGASGDMNLTVADSHTLLKRVVGTLPSLSRDDVLGSTPKQSASVNESAVRYDSYGNRIEDGVYDNTRNASLDADNQDWAASLSGIFRSMVTTTVRTNLAKLIRDLNINILEVDSYLDALSFSLREKVRPGFEAYGLTVTQFFVTNVSLPEDDQNFKKLRELSAASYIGTREAEVQADIVRAKREVEIEKGTTENEMARLEAQREIIRAQAEAEKRRLSRKRRSCRRRATTRRTSSRWRCRRRMPRASARWAQARAAQAAAPSCPIWSDSAWDSRRQARSASSSRICSTPTAVPRSRHRRRRIRTAGAVPPAVKQATEVRSARAAESRSPRSGIVRPAAKRAIREPSAPAAASRRTVRHNETAQM